MSSTGETPTAPRTRGQKRNAEAEERRRQEEAAVKQKNSKMFQARKIQGALPNSGMVTLIGPNDMIQNSKNPLKIKIEEEAEVDVDVKPEVGRDETPNNENGMGCSTTPTDSLSQNQVGGEVVVKEEVEVPMDWMDPNVPMVGAQVLDEELGTNFPQETGCVRCQDLEKIGAEKDLRIKELEEQLKSLKQKCHQDVVSKLVQEVDGQEKVKLNQEHTKKDNPIFLAILEGKSKGEIQRLVESGEEWDVPNASGDTVLHLAAKAGRSEIIEYFISISDQPLAHVHAKNSSGSTPEMEAAKSGKNFLQVFNVLMKNGADVEVEAGYKYRILKAAIVGGRSAQEIEKIVRSSPNLNYFRQFNSGNTALHVATASGNLEAVKYFLSLSPDVNAGNKMNETPLMTATRAEKNFLAIVYLLQKNGANISFRNKRGEDVLHSAIERRRTSDDLEFLITAGATWNTRRTDGKSILHVCAERGNVEAMRYFIRKGADVNAVDNDGVTPVILAAQWGMCDVMNFLIEIGADFEASKLRDLAISGDVEGSGGLLETIKLLSEHGATLNDASRVEVFHKFVEYGNLEGVRYFILNGMDVNVKDTNSLTPVMKAITGSLGLHVEVFDLLMEMGADVHAVDMDGFNVLHFAIREYQFNFGREFLELFQKLIQHGATWSNGVMGEEPHQESILHAAMRSGHAEIVQYFISKGVDVNAKDASGDTPFLHAVREEVPNLGEILQALGNAGGDPNSVDNEGNTALLVGMNVMLDSGYQRSEEKLQLAPLRLLVALGCDSRIPNEKGETVLGVLKEHGKFNLLKYFKRSV